MTNNQATLAEARPDAPARHGAGAAHQHGNPGPVDRRRVAGPPGGCRVDDRHERRLKRAESGPLSLPVRHRGGGLRLRRNLDQNQLLRLATIVGRSLHQASCIRQMLSGTSFLASALGTRRSERVPESLPGVLAAVRRTAPGVRRQLRSGTGLDEEAGSADHQSVGAAGRPARLVHAGVFEEPTLRLDEMVSQLQVLSWHEVIVERHHRDATATASCTAPTDRPGGRFDTRNCMPSANNAVAVYRALAVTNANAAISKAPQGTAVQGPTADRKTAGPDSAALAGCGAHPNRIPGWLERGSTICPTIFRSPRSHTSSE